MSPSAVDNQIEIHTDDKMHDSGVAFQASASAPSATTGRFYGTRHSSSRRGETHDEDAHRGRSYSRSRGQSFGTDATPASRSRSRSLSPDMFPYSPPQVDTLWPHVKDIYAESSDALFPDTETETDNEKDTDAHTHTLGVEGMTWLRASLDIPRLDNTEKTPASINVSVTAMPAAAPRRFYSTRQQPCAKERGYDIAGAGWDGSHSRTPSVDDAVSLQSFSSVEDDGTRQEGFYQLRRSVSSRGFDQQQGHGQDPVYTIVSGAGHRRRRKASHLLKKLAGLGKKKDADAFESRRVVVAVAV